MPEYPMWMRVLDRIEAQAREKGWTPSMGTKRAFESAYLSGDVFALPRPADVEPDVWLDAFHELTDKIDAMERSR